MTGHGEKISRKRESAIAALLAEPNLAAAAKRAGVSERTLRRWMHLPEFKQSFDEARSVVFDSALTLLHTTSVEAVETLRACLNSDSDPTRVRASAVILERGFAAHEVSSLAVRLAALEAKVRSRAE